MQKLKMLKIILLTLTCIIVLGISMLYVYVSSYSLMNSLTGIYTSGAVKVRYTPEEENFNNFIAKYGVDADDRYKEYIDNRRNYYYEIVEVKKISEDTANINVFICSDKNETLAFSYKNAKLTASLKDKFYYIFYHQGLSYAISDNKKSVGYVYINPQKLNYKKFILIPPDKNQPLAEYPAIAGSVFNENAPLHQEKNTTLTFDEWKTNAKNILEIQIQKDKEEREHRLKMVNNTLAYWNQIAKKYANSQ